MMIVATPWTILSSLAFEEIVNELAELVDDLCITPGTRAWENVFKRMIKLKIGFWPEHGEELVTQ